MTDTMAQSPEVVSLGQPGGVVTFVDGTTFCISGRGGDIRSMGANGFFFQDARYLSQWDLTINGKPLEPLSVALDTPFSGTFVARARPRPGRADSTIVVFRRRAIGVGMREEIVVKNFAEEESPCQVQLTVDADFADVFEVKEDRVQPHGERGREVRGNRVVIRHRHEEVDRHLEVIFDAPTIEVDDNAVVFEPVIEANGEWKLVVEVVPVVGVVPESSELRFEAATKPVERLAAWRSNVPKIQTDHHALALAVHKGQEDLGSLRMFDREFTSHPVIAAGAPWFMTLFGRDSLLTAWMSLLVDPDLSIGVLDALAHFQGKDVNPLTDEEPGRILHEMRTGMKSGMLGFNSSQVYYGTADATPLFVMLLGELRRWGLAPELTQRLLPHADRALSWIHDFGDRDGDGYVEYERAHEHGIANQGWKDSFDSIRYSDGRLSTTPIALAEVQGYVYAAYQARKWFAREAGDEVTAERYKEKAVALRAAFNRDFWLEDRECFAMALDGDKKPVDALGSNMGHCLWTGIIDDDKAEAVARHLLSPAMFTGWGIRTLGSTMVGYNPIGYHTGSVWPHDTAICAAGLMRYGFIEEAQRVILGLLAAAVPDGGRLPELFSGLDASELSIPVSFPTSCSPQAWAAASPLLALRTLLRFHPSVPQGALYVAPELPPAISRLRVENIPLQGRRVTVAVDGDRVDVTGLEGTSIEIRTTAAAHAAQERRRRASDAPEG